MIRNTSPFERPEVRARRLEQPVDQGDAVVEAKASLTGEDDIASLERGDLLEAFRRTYPELRGQRDDAFVVDARGAEAKVSCRVPAAGLDESVRRAMSESRHSIFEVELHLAVRRSRELDIER